MKSHPPAPDPWLDSVLHAERSAPAPDGATQQRMWQRLETRFALADGAAAQPSAPPSLTAPPQFLPGNLGLWIAAPIFLGCLSVGAIALSAQADLSRSDMPDRTNGHGDMPPMVVEDEPVVTVPVVMAAPIVERLLDSLVAFKPRRSSRRSSRQDAPELRENPIKPGLKLIPAQSIRVSPYRIKPRPQRRRRKGPRGLRDEVRLIRAAREALGRGDVRAAQSALRKHAGRYKNGQLREEREALAVISLARAGSRVQAKVAARAFLRHYPNSMQTQIVRAVLSAKP